MEEKEVNKSMSMNQTELIKELHNDILKLALENERLKAEIERLKSDLEKVQK